MFENIEEKTKNKIIDSINLKAGGRLVISKPEKNKLGADLVVTRRGNYKEEGYFLKVNSLVGPTPDAVFKKDFLQSEIVVQKNFYLVFAYFDKVKQQISDYVWLVPSTQLRDLAEVVKSEDGKDVLRFEVPLDIKDKTKFSKYLVNTKDLGKLIIDAFETGGKFNFKDGGFEETEKINIDNLKEFLSQARRGSYAGNATPVENPRLLGSVQFSFQKGEYVYLDIYFQGNKNFVGQEIVYQNSKPIWGMSYMGNNIGKLETSFLKESLFKLSEKCRFGQTCASEKREYKYTDRGQGDLSKFSGTEEVFISNKNIYTLNYQGGLISEKL